MKRLTKKSFSELVFDVSTEKFKGKRPTVVKFYYDNCASCDIMSPIFEKLALENENVDFYQMKAGSDLDVSDYFKIDELPGFLIITAKSHITFKGQMPKIVFQKRIDAFLGE